MPLFTRTAPTRSFVGLATVTLLAGAATAAPSPSRATTAPAHAARAATTSTPPILNAVVAALPSWHHPDAPFYAVFSTAGPLTKSKDDEGTLRIPGGVGVDGPAAMTIYPTAKPHAHMGTRWCYAAEASGTVWDELEVGHTYPVLIATSNDKSVKRWKQPRKIRTRTIQNAAIALGC